MRILPEEKMMLNYVKSMQGEYGDDFFENDSRENVYWNMALSRKHSVSCYSFEADKEVLIVGDIYGAITGSVCEIAYHVDMILPTKEHAEAVSHRYQNRKNLNIIIKEDVTWQLDKKYSYVIVNLDYCGEYNITDAYEYECLTVPAIAHLQQNGKLILLETDNRLYHLERLLYKHGFFYWHYCDPLRNGELLIEASRDDDLSEWNTADTCLLSDDKWVRRHGIPYRGSSRTEQDKELIDKVVPVQLELLEKLLEVCQKAKLRVYPMYGTLLGLMRDGGMIPGDDDIDVALPREDFDKLLQLSDQFETPYFLQTPFNDECFFGGYVKLRNVNTTAIHPQNYWTNACEGISIDIFPMDITYSKECREIWKCRKIRFLQRFLYAKPYGYFKEFKDMPMLEWKAYKYAGKLLDRDKLTQRLYRVMKSGDSRSNRWAIYCHYGTNAKDAVRYLDRNAFKNSFMQLYEGIPMQVPQGWDSLLRGLYGDNYTDRRGYDEYKRRHGFYDTTIPYQEYKYRFSGLKNPKGIKENIVLVGDGSLFSKCLTIYKNRVHFEYLVLLPNEKLPEEKIDGVPVLSWEHFQSLNISEKTNRIIICSGNVRSAEKVLIDAGYHEYYIYWYNREWMLYASQTQIWREACQ